jgi:hypothetical protein
MRERMAEVPRAISRITRQMNPTQRLIRQVSTERLSHTVPLESRSRIVGTDYIERLANDYGGRYQRDLPDIGLMNDSSILAGSKLNPEDLHPLVREFYEHTTRFELHVVPRWHPLARPGFFIFRKLVAEQIKQFNLPFRTREARDPVESHIDTIDLDSDEVVDVRGWIRTYKDSELPIYVGIYTTFRPPAGNDAYVSVGFPLPDANLTATLMPKLLGTNGLSLTTSKRGSEYAGDYLVLVEGDTVQAFRIEFLTEKINVYPASDAELGTDHRFYLFGIRFLKLLYRIRRKSG